MQPVRVTPQSVFNTQSTTLTTFLQSAAALNHLYPHQIDATLAVARFLADPNRPDIALAVLPTGAGKSGIAVLAAYATNSARVLVITPSLKISQQLAIDFKLFLYQRGVFPAGTPPHHVVPTMHVVVNSSDFPTCLTNAVVITNAHKIGGRSRIAIASIPRDFDLVIVDEAHHYPADTWRLLVDHFQGTKRLFLTATPSWRGGEILVNQQQHLCYQLRRLDAIAGGIIRDLAFEEVGDSKDDQKTAFGAIGNRIRGVLARHDGQDNTTFHQAMILTQTRQDLNAAVDFMQVYNQGLAADSPDRCEMYVSGTGKKVLADFQTFQFRTLIVIGRLLEGFDHKNVSVVAIARNVQLSSRVLFAQFVGRAVRKIRPNDPVNAVLVSHVIYNQQPNFDSFEQLPDEDLAESDDD